MPTYTYKCKKCGNEFDKFQSMAAEPLQNCEYENCDGEVKRLIGMGAGAILKGSGFYQTDFKNTAKQKAAEPQQSGKCHSCPSANSCEKAAG
jgi:putative FmdB family regulatory protein